VRETPGYVLPETKPTTRPVTTPVGGVRVMTISSSPVSNVPPRSVGKPSGFTWTVTSPAATEESAKAPLSSVVPARTLKVAWP
jgi:hypothetical protein